MKKLLSIFLLICTLPAAGQWRTTTPLGTDINDITFTDDSTGYAVSRGGFAGSCNVGFSIYKTIDGGENWIRLRAGITERLVGVHFVNSLVGWIAAETSKVLKTTDGGMTWVEQTSGVGSGYNAIWFLDENTGFVTGNNGMLRRTTNGGATWTTITSGTTTNLNRIFFYDDQLGFIAGQNGTLLKTVNGGNSWTTQNFGAAVLRDVAFTSPTTGYAIGFSGGEKIWKTENGGTDWTSSSIAVTARRVVFPTENTGYLLGLENGILKTVDAGATWSPQSPTGNNPLIGGAIFFHNADYGFVAGDRAVIARTFDGGATWENVNSAISGEVTSVSLPQKDIAYCANEAGRMYKTANGGVSYKDITPPVTVPINKLLFLDSQTGFAAGTNGVIARTTDGGMSWSPAQTAGNATVTDLSFVDQETGYASASGGTVLKTQNGGLNWAALSTGFPGVDFNNVWFVNPDTGFVTGSNTGGAIYRTLDGGASWTAHDSGPTGVIRDIVFTNDSLGYCAKTQRVLITKNAGTTWEVQSTPSPAISQLFMYNDSSGYAAYGTSQASTTDSCASFSTAFTACFAGNFLMRTIDGTPDGNYAFAMGAGGLVNQLDPAEISKVTVTGNAYCPGSTVFVAFFGRGFWGLGNTFTAELSDANGSFDNPVTIGSYPATPTTYCSGVITASIPAGTPDGQYRIRVTASDPALTGPDNGQDITIQTVTPTVTIDDNLSNPLCQSAPLELSAVFTDGGMSPSFQWTLNGAPAGEDDLIYMTDSLTEGDVVTVTMTSSLSCAVPSTAVAVYEVVFGSIETGLAGDTAVCAGSELTLSADPGFTYSWTPTAGLDDPTSANPTATVTEAVTYVLEISDEFGCTATDSIAVGILDDPELLSSDTLACPGSLVQLQATPGGTYSWSPAAGLDDPAVFNPIATVEESITYTLTATGPEGCTLVDSVRIDAFSLPVITLWTDTLLCADDCIEFTPSVNAEIQSAVWTPGAGLSDPDILNPTFCAAQAETFTLTVTDLNGCEASHSVAVNLHPLPETPAITFDGTALATDPGSAYQWFLNGELIDGATGQAYIPAVNGLYSVLVTDAEGCAAMSEDFDLNTLGLGGGRLIGIAVYPNPTSGMLTLVLDQNVHTFLNMELTDLSGRRLRYTEEFNERTDLSALASGVYLLRINTAGGSHLERIAVKH